MHNNVISIIRVTVAGMVGFVLSLLATHDVQVPAEFADAFNGLATFLLSSAYYIAVRLLSEKFPQVEWLLGVPAKPEYKK